MRGKQWTEEELATIEVLKVPAGSGREQSLSRAAHDRGRLVVSSQQYAYQATVTDQTTGIIHVFGYTRREPPTWQWASIHPSSAKLHIEQRAQQLEDAKKQWAADKAKAAGGSKH